MADWLQSPNPLLIAQASHGLRLLELCIFSQELRHGHVSLPARLPVGLPSRRPSVVIFVDTVLHNGYRTMCTGSRS
jgi:hypothetical protein